MKSPVVRDPRPALRLGLFVLFALTALLAGCGSSVGDQPAEARALLDEIEARFARPLPNAEHSDRPDLRTPFGARIERSFVSTENEGLTLAPKPKLANVGRGTRALATFPKRGKDGLFVSVEHRPSAWIRVKPQSTTASARSVEDGLVVYPNLLPGVDAIYAVDEARIEEWLYLHHAQSTSGLVFEAELGSEIANLRVDGSGAGLEAVDAHGRVLLRAPMPEGVDANGNYVRGKLVAEATGAGRFVIRLELTTPAPAFPVLLDPSWVGTGSMAVDRAYPATALLSSGKVLVMGGYSGWFPVTSAELYDPATGTYSSTGALNGARSSASANVLASGKVLVAGGTGQSSRLATAELYDPSTGSFTQVAGQLGTARAEHTATLLPSGQVLIVAGRTQTDLLASTELFDPASNQFSVGPSLSIARAIHTATRLPTGEVLVAGGLADGNPTAAAEIYDPISNAFTNTQSPLRISRLGHTATLLPSGKVLIAGGRTTENYTARYVNEAELYDPNSRSFELSGSLSAPRRDHSATLLPSGKVLVAGGNTGSSPMNSAELFDPDSGEFTSAGTLPSARTNHSAILLASGKVLLVGSPNNQQSSSADVYDPSEGAFAYTGAPGKTTYHTATLLPSGKVLVAGGFGDTLLASAQLYDPKTKQFTDTGSLAMGRYQHTATLLSSGKVLIVGGRGTGSTRLASAELYDPESGAFSSAGSLRQARQEHTATLLPSGKVLVAGGNDRSGRLSSAEIYDPEANAFSDTGSLLTIRQSHTATRLESGKVLVVGGYGSTGYEPTAELYDPSSGTFSLTPFAPASARGEHTATLLPSGKVLVAGGLGLGTPKLAELYDPATGRFSNIGELSLSAHTAVPLASGKVLLTGGYSKDARLYDPATGLFSDTAALLEGRTHHTMTLLPSGKVLVVAGNASGDESLETAELYDEGFGYSDEWRPVVASVSGVAIASGTLTIAGTRLLGNGEGSSGHNLSSATNHPLVRLVHGESGEVVYARVFEPSGGWKGSSTTLQAELPAKMSPGPHWLYVVANGIPSEGVHVFVKTSQGEGCSLDDDCGTGFCVDGVCCDTACGGGDTKDCQACSKAAGAETDGVCGPRLNGSACDDGDGCTQSDTCEAGACVGSDPVICRALDQCHLAGACDPATGACSHPEKENGTICDDGNACTQTDTCQAGACEGSDLVVCEALGQCHDVGTCDPGTGICSNPEKPKDTPCDDGDGCSQSDTCQEGICVGADPVSCANDGTCQSATGLCSCLSGFAGALCQYSDAETCLGHGIALNDGTCECQAKYGGTGCGECAGDHYGYPSCQPKKAAGVACINGIECMTGHCADEVCCDTTCTGQCEACDLEGSVGTCSPVTGDPRNGRQECDSDGSSCGGSCDGTRREGCAYPTMSCREGSCDADENTATLSASCDGQGSCPDVQTQSCEPFTCGKKGCLGDCDTDSDCEAADGFCAGGLCQDKFDLGEGCAGDNQCESGFCVDGVCCESACSGQCEACGEADREGSCVAVSGAPRPGRDACAGTGACQGSCNGEDASQCAFPGATTSCAPGACTEDKATAESFCDGAGACEAGMQTGCGGYACGADICKTSCGDDGDCASGYRCEADACIANTDADAGADAGDSGSETDADPDGEPGFFAEPEVIDEGCNCRAAGGSSRGVHAAWLGIAIAALASRRRASRAHR